MRNNFCTQEELDKTVVGQLLKISARYETLKREDGSDFPFVARKNDVVVVQRKSPSGLVVLFYEDVVRLATRGRENYGEFLVEPLHIQKF